jgi:hypothetical protein
MWQELQTLDKKVESLRSKVRRAVEPYSATSRELVTLIAQELTCEEDDLDEKTATFYNGSADSYVLQKFSVEVTAKEKSSALAADSDQRIVLSRYAFGYMRPVPDRPRAPEDYTIGPFDFVWNYLVSSRQSYYSRQYLGSTVFNGLERAQTFNLHEPLVLKPVDSIEFRMKPIAYALPGTSFKFPDRVYFVNFLAFGFRRPL